MEDQRKIRDLLVPLFASYGRAMAPASEEALHRFSLAAENRGLPRAVVVQLSRFYQVTNGVPCLDSFDFHACDDQILFEWWDRQELWLGQRDFYTLRWAAGRFCLGDAANVSFSAEHEYETLVELLYGAFREWSGGASYPG
jgi:hypothetical protein